MLWRGWRLQSCTLLSGAVSLLLGLCRCGLRTRLTFYRHRTVTDFLALQETADLIERWSEDDFDMHESLCEAFVLCARQTGHLTTSNDAGIFFGFCTEAAIHHAAKIELAQQRTLSKELNRLICCVETHHDLSSHLEERWKAPSTQIITPIAVSYGLDIFLEKTAAAGNMELRHPHPSGPLLQHVLSDWRGYYADHLSVQLISTLLQCGNTPNELCVKKIEIPGNEPDSPVSTREIHASV